MAESAISLYALNHLIKKKTAEQFPRPYWIVAEILEMNVNRSGHCYMELIEKSGNDDRIIAKSRATIWANRYNMLRAFFQTTTGSPLRQGIKVLVRAEVSFHELYGLSLNISDIDPSYTLGDLAMKRREVIDKLTKAGVMDMNRELPLTAVPQKIAVISSETAAGYGDFMDTLLHNPYSFRFSVSLFPAIMQGDSAEHTIIEALEQIHGSSDEFDAVVLIRGGGSQADLQCFNGYDLCFHLAQFPIPVLTGIGHERDESVADMVAHTYLKTPTAVAEFLVDRLLEFSSYLEELGDRFREIVQGHLNAQEQVLREFEKDLKSSAKALLQNRKYALGSLNGELLRTTRKGLKKASEKLAVFSGKAGLMVSNRLSVSRKQLMLIEESSRKLTRSRLKNHNERIGELEKQLKLLRPERVLARGYSITSVNGRLVKSVKDIQEGDRLETRLLDGSIESSASNLKKNFKS